MPGPRARRIVLEFDDGSTAESGFEALPVPLQRDLLGQPFAARPSSAPEEEAFVVLQWNDGWQEVLKVDPAFREIIRYYVIRRPEDVGRLSLNQDDGYPELIEIGRKPMDLRRITFRDAFGCQVVRTEREGTKQDHFFGLTREGEAFAEEAAAFKRAVEELGIDPAVMREADPSRIQDECQRIGRHMGLKAARCQQDLRDFIAYLARRSD